jgi:hypothetical protein
VHSWDEASHSIFNGPGVNEIGESISRGCTRSLASVQVAMAEAVSCMLSSRFELMVAST